MINESQFEKNGITYKNVKTDDAFDGVTTIGGLRMVIKGKAQITLMKGSGKFGDQIQFSLYAPKSTKIIEETRNPSDYNKLEIDLPIEVALQMMEKIREYVEVKNGRRTKLAN